MVSAAYADPPYIGQSRRHYKDDPRCAEVDHAELISLLTEDYDRWALSLSSTSLREILPLCPADIRICAWVKPFCAFKKMRVQYTWEPVILYGAPNQYREKAFARDHLATNPCTKKNSKGIHGAKPPDFCRWIFQMLDLGPGDTLADLYPGSGNVTRAWAQWQRTQQSQLTVVCPDR